jgi:tyrosine-protein phosphatase OCA6
MGEDRKTKALLVPPFHFGTVIDKPCLYRGSYPRHRNLEFLRRLRLRTILSLTPQTLGDDSEIARWCQAEGVRLVHITVDVEKKKSNVLGHMEAKAALEILTRRVYYPM